jgi:hypothetical protein
MVKKCEIINMINISTWRWGRKVVRSVPERETVFGAARRQDPQSAQRSLGDGHASRDRMVKKCEIFNIFNMPGWL